MLGIALVAVFYLFDFIVKSEEEIHLPPLKKLEPAKEKMIGT